MAVKKGIFETPTFGVLLGLGMISLFTTFLWLALRVKIAYIYGLIRKVELPFFWQYFPNAEMFTRDTLVAGYRPPFASIYINSIYYGLLMAVFTMVVMFLALRKLSKAGVKQHIKAGNGLPYNKVMSYYATDNPSVQFFIDYSVLDLPTDKGEARQPLPAMKVLQESFALKGLIEEKSGLSRLNVDRSILKGWLADRMGPRNPFIDFSSHKLLRAVEIENAIDELPWTSVLIAYPSLWKFHSFLVDGDDGFKHTQKCVESFIDDTWVEINKLKKKYGNSVVLGFADTNARDIASATYADLPKKKKIKGRNTLQTFGEVIDIEGPDFKCVKDARAGLKYILTRHLGRDTNEYPYGEDSKTGVILYGPKDLPKGKLRSNLEQAFMKAKITQLDEAAISLSQIVFNHGYVYGFVGAALNAVRETGIMPALHFRWLRYYDRPFWLFVHNLGMPSAVPEASGAYEHYQAEVMIKAPLSGDPHINTCLDGLIKEAEEYLTDDRIAEFRREYGATKVKKDISDARQGGEPSPRNKAIYDIFSNDEVKTKAGTASSEKNAEPLKAEPDNNPESSVDENTDFGLVIPLGTHEFSDRNHVKNFVRYLFSQTKNHPTRDTTEYNMAVEWSQGAGGSVADKSYMLSNAKKCHSNYVKRMLGKISDPSVYMDDGAYVAFIFKVDDVCFSNFVTVDKDKPKEYTAIPDSLYEMVRENFPSSDQFNMVLTDAMAGCQEIIDFDQADMTQREILEYRLHMCVNDVLGGDVVLSVSHNDQKAHNPSYHIHRIRKWAKGEQATVTHADIREREAGRDTYAGDRMGNSG